jgi:hypothetical protein
MNSFYNKKGKREKGLVRSSEFEKRKPKIAFKAKKDPAGGATWLPILVAYVIGCVPNALVFQGDAAFPLMRLHLQISVSLVTVRLRQ